MTQSPTEPCQIKHQRAEKLKPPKTQLPWIMRTLVGHFCQQLTTSCLDNSNLLACCSLTHLPCSAGLCSLPVTVSSGSNPLTLSHWDRCGESMVSGGIPRGIPGHPPTVPPVVAVRCAVGRGCLVHREAKAWTLPPAARPHRRCSCLGRAGWGQRERGIPSHHGVWLFLPFPGLSKNAP